MTRGGPGVGPAVSAAAARPVAWVAGLGAVGAVVLLVGLLVQVRCAVGRCPAPALWQLFALDALGGLPRLFVVAVFLAVAVVAARAAGRSSRRRATWWSAVAGGGVALAIAKAVSSHSRLEHGAGRSAVLAGAVLLAVLFLSLLWRAGCAWSVPAATPVTLALAAYALAALGLDEVTVAVQQGTGSPAVAAVLVFVEECGEAVTALLVLAVVAAGQPRR